MVHIKASPFVQLPIALHQLTEHKSVSSSEAQPPLPELRDQTILVSYRFYSYAYSIAYTLYKLYRYRPGRKDMVLHLTTSTTNTQ